MAFQKKYRILTLISALALAFSLGACSSGKNNSEAIKKSGPKDKALTEESEAPEAGEQDLSKPTPAGSDATTLDDQLNVVVLEGPKGRGKRFADQTGLGHNASSPEESEPADFSPDIIIEDSGSDLDRQSLEQAGGNSRPLITGGRDPRTKNFFTDGKNDVVMSRLINRMEEMKVAQGDEFFLDSIEFSKILYNVDVNANIHTGEVDVKVQFIDGSRDVTAVFNGNLRNGRQVSLNQIVRDDDKGYRFYAYVTCIDANGVECKNTILVLEHVVNGEVCKRMFVVHRFGDAEMLLSNSDYTNFSFYENDSHRAFMEYLANTVHMNRYLETCIQTGHTLNPRQGDQTCEQLQSLNTGAGDGFNGRLPFAAVIGYRSWAAAYGAAFFNLFFRESQRGDDLIDVLHIYGPLLYSSHGPAYDRNLEIEGYATTPEGHARRTGSTFADSIRSVQLLHNDGMGKLDLSFVFKGSPYSRAFVDFQEYLGETLDPVSLSLYPKQPKGLAPEMEAPQVYDDEVDETAPPQEQDLG